LIELIKYQKIDINEQIYCIKKILPWEFALILENKGASSLQAIYGVRGAEIIEGADTDRPHGSRYHSDNG
jgi:hypothetical protein